MIEIVIICITAFLTAILTFFSGFGLGTILSPVMMLFFPVEIAVALTGVVHFSNNLFKLWLVGKKADIPTVLRFGLPAIVAAFIGAWLLLQMSTLPIAFSYQLWNQHFEVSYFKIIMAVLLFPYFGKLEFSPKMITLGGFITGFFGGFSGHQGALRSAFLIRSGLKKEAFIATGVLVSSMIDLTRVGVYTKRLMDVKLEEYWVLIVVASLSAMLGAVLGNRLLKKVTMKSLQYLVAVFLILIAMALGLGWL
jgi:uncharacterized membrane protein YfcA